MAQTQEIADAVWRAFRADPRLGPGFKLARVSVEGDGALTLEGVVASLAQKKLALRRAAAVSGPGGIIDRLRVAPVAEINDGAMRARLRQTFAQDADFADLDIREDTAVGEAATRYEPVSGAGGEARGRIDIEVENGVVVLNGFVPTLVRKRLAGAMAWWMPGVRDVVNALVVRPAEDDGPDQIEEAVRVVLDRDPAVEAAQIKVGVRGPVVRLSGLARTPAERDAAERDAWAVFAVDDVINEIALRP